MKAFGSPKFAISERGDDTSETFIAKFVAPKKWKKHMLTVLEEMQGGFSKNKLLIIDLITIVNAIPEQNFVEATLQIRPFKPEFIQSQPLLAHGTLSTMAETVAKAAHFKKDFEKTKMLKEMSHRVTEQTLVKEFNRPYHPFRFILSNVRRLLELKYKSLIDNKKIKMAQIQKQLKSDLQAITEFFKQASLPYRKLFKLEDEKEQTEASKKLSCFIANYILQNEKINKTLKKIIVYASRAQVQASLEQKIAEFPKIEDFNMPEDFRIDGCYIRAINSLMEFSTGSKPQQSLQKLIDLRKNILTDIDEFYLSENGERKDLQVCAEVQIQIIRFILAKLRGWASEIYAQLKYLQVVYGDEQMAYKFEDASFIYAQLCTVFEILGIE